MTKNILDGLYQSSLQPVDESEIIHVPDLCRMAPNLHDFMRYEYYQGEPTVPPKLTFQVQGGILWAGLSDSERTRYCRFEVEGIEHGLVFIEGLINSATLAKHFRPWPGHEKAAAKNGGQSSKKNGSRTRTSKATSSPTRTAKNPK